MFEKGLLSGYDEIKLLGHFTTGVYYVLTSFPAKTPPDLKGHKLRVVNKVQADMLKEIDAIGVGMPITKVPENLSRGVIEGIIADLSILFDFRLDEVVKNHLFVPMGVTSVLIVMNKQKYESLPAKAKAAIDRHGSEVVRMFAETVEAQNEENLEKIMSDPKHTIVRPTADDLKQWEKVIQPVMETWKRENPKQVKLIAIYREELEKAKRKR
jgi:TRAP-type C4-dicarboxylate transport system substrate-binding protein